MFAVGAFPVTYAVVVVGVVVGKLHTYKPAELIGRGVAGFDMFPQLIVCLVFAPILRPESVKDISSVPIGAAFWTQASMVKTHRVLLVRETGRG